MDRRRYKMNMKTIFAISKYTELVQLKLILPGINETNTKYLLEKCAKLTELCFECNFLTAVDAENWYESFHTFADVNSKGVSLERWCGIIVLWIIVELMELKEHISGYCR
ncbi:hypothetical protein HA402_013361 [Bradysia odoriphaga]|nr:hypothetical protein HA402_013361 [Bradysia odoriphaga]